MYRKSPHVLWYHVRSLPVTLTTEVCRKFSPRGVKPAGASNEGRTGWHVIGAPRLAEPVLTRRVTRNRKWQGASGSLSH